jgi:ABC-type polysaccharide/polyol phosphate export permease
MTGTAPLNPAIRSGPANVWRYRQLLHSLALRNLKVKYQRSLLGFVWTLLNPLLTVAVLVAVFSYVVRIPIAHYWAFLLSGYFVWNFMAQSLNAGTYVVAEHSQLCRAVAFPKIALVLAATTARLAEFTIELAIVLIALCIFHHGAIPVSFVLLPWLMVVLFLTSLGLALPIATLSVFYHDVKHALPILLTTLFYVSPVFYPVRLVPEAARPYYMANPIAGVLTLFHGVVYEGQMPAVQGLVSVTVYCALLVSVGYAIFRRFEPLFAEVV